MKNNKKIILLILSILLFIIFLPFLLRDREMEVKLTYYKTIKCPYGTIEGSTDDFDMIPYWEMAYDEFDIGGVIPRYCNSDCIDLSDVDFDKYKVCISRGRRIKKMVYAKSNVYPWFPYQHDGFRDGVAYLESKYCKDRFYIYLIDKKTNVRNTQERPDWASYKIVYE